MAAKVKALTSDLAARGVQATQVRPFELNAGPLPRDSSASERCRASQAVILTGRARVSHQRRASHGQRSHAACGRLGRRMTLRWMCAPSHTALWDTCLPAQVATLLSFFADRINSSTTPWT